MSTPQRCPRHEWADLFPGPQKAADAYFGGGAHYAWSRYQICTGCLRIGLKSETGGTVRTLGAHEVKAYGILPVAELWHERLAEWREYHTAHPHWDGAGINAFRRLPASNQEVTV